MKKSFIIVFITCFALLSCEKKELQEFTNTKEENLVSTNQFYDYLESIGFSKNSVKEFEDYYLVEGDILFRKEKNYAPQLKQAYVKHLGSLLYWDNQNDITVQIDNSIPTNGFDNWRPSITDAINDWNSISDTRIRFRLVTSNADITIRSDNGELGPKTIAIATFPDGTPGEEIRINLDASQNRIITATQMRYNIVHELGHCIGLRHTNWKNRREILPNHIPDTPEDDINSVMNGGTAFHGWKGFSYYDIRAIQVIYPQSRYHQLGGAVWANTNAMTDLNGSLYLVQNSRLYRVNANNGSYSQLGGAVWANTNAMTNLNGWIYLVQNSRLYRVNANNGSYSQLGSAVWANTNAMTSLNGWIYLVQNNRLYRVNANNGSYTQLGGAVWANTNAMTVLNGWLYLVQNSRLYLVNATDGSYTQIGSAEWKDTEGMTAKNGWIYIVQSKSLHKVNSKDGSYTLLGGPVWASTGGITSFGEELYIAQNSRLYKVFNVD